MLPLNSRFDLKYPIIQAPMAGGGDTPELVAAVSEAGGIGCIGAAYLQSAQILEASAAVRRLTARPFGVNLFMPVPPEGLRVDASALDRVAGFYQELGLPAPDVPQMPPDLFPTQLAACLDSSASFLSFTFGIPLSEHVRAIRNRGLFCMATASTVEEAISIEKAGMNAVIAQGSEAGGHRSTFARAFESSMIGTIALVPQVVDAVSIPVIASGGIMDGRGIIAALALGASAVQMGTAFLMCSESGVSEACRLAILNAREDQTRVTRAFSGRPARGIVNRFMEEIDAGPILPFPLQNALTRPLRTAAARQQRAEFLSLWAGQGIRMARRQTASELIARLAEEMEATQTRLRGYSTDTK